MILCRHCGSSIEPNESVCRECGKPAFQADSPIVSTAGQQVSRETQPAQTLVGAVPPNLRRKFPVVAVVLVLLLTATISVAITLALVDRRSSVLSSNVSAASPSPASRISGSSAASTELRAIPTGAVPLKITVVASSTRLSSEGNTYDPKNVLDGKLSSAWDEGVSGPGIGEWIRFDLDRQIRLTAIRIVPGYFKNAQLWAHNNRLAAATFYFSDGTSRHFVLDDRMAEQSLEVGGVKTSSVRMTIDRVYGGSFDSEDTPISEIAFNWEP